MRFILRSVFWLGLVYHAMPWGDARLTDALPGPAPSLVTLASANGESAVSQLARAALRGTLDAETPSVRAAPAAAPRPASLDTLTPEDRRAPWRGPGARIGT